MMTKPLIRSRTGNQRVSVALSELLQLSASARQLSLAALRRTNPHSGQRMSRLLARGMEFAESRRYQTGDDIRNIDWRVTARTGKTHTKLFTVEKERRVLLSVDMQSSMFFATKGSFKSVQAALMMGYVAWSAEQAGDRLGGMIFDDVDLFESRPTLGKKGILPFLNALAERSDFLTKKNDSNGTAKGSMMDLAIANLRQIATPGSLVFIISDFRHLSSSAYNLLLQISMHSDLCLCFIYDPIEKALPKNGYFPVTDGKNEVQLNTYAKKSLEKYQQQFIERRERIASLGNQRHIHFIECSTEDDCFEVLTKRFNKRS